MDMRPIGVIRSPFREREGMPIQPTGATGVMGSVELHPDYAEGLADLDGFSHVVLIYVFDKSVGFDLKVVPFMDDTPRGLFATRAPRRPNPIGLSVVRLESIEGTTLEVEGLDVLDETPLLDIKPYVPAFDAPTQCRTGWLEQARKNAQETRSDERFS